MNKDAHLSATHLGQLYGGKALEIVKEKNYYFVSKPCDKQERVKKLSIK